jgi:hypothetical protein
MHYNYMLLPAHAGSSIADFSTLKMEAIRSSETPVHFTGSTRRHIPEFGILHSQSCENLKSYIIPVFLFRKSINLKLVKIRVLYYKVLRLFGSVRNEVRGEWENMS